MIQSLEIRNFKSIKHKCFEFRNLNILLGLNGQGKSSLIQSLLLMRQSDRLSWGELTLNGGDGGLVNIGTTKDALYQYNDDKTLSLNMKFAENELLQMEFDYGIDADVFRPKEKLSASIPMPQDSIFTNNFQYLTAQRIEPKSINATSYSHVMEANSIGKYGQYTAHYIELRGDEDIAFENILHEKSLSHDAITNKTIIDKSLRNQINLWLSEISPGVQVVTTKISSDIILLEYSFQQPNFGNTNKFKPDNVGFGISYALHVVTALLSAKPGQLIIIENPESHIHPRGQAELGKLIAKTAQNDVQIIIETHSDHIFNGIRVAVKDESIDKNKVIGFYFQKIVTEKEQYSQITDIEIDKNGTLSEYPENLLDEWSNQMSKLI